MKFKVGQKVKVNNKSKYFNKLKNLIGTIDGFDSTTIVVVKWPNSLIEEHSEERLDLATLDYIKSLKGNNS